MEYRLLTLEQQDKTAVVRISRPEKKNALSIDLIEELSLMAEDLKKRTDLIAVVLTGGDSYFSPGVDLSDPKLYALFGEGLAEKRRAMEYAPRMCRAWEELDQFTIAAIEGFCVGGAVALTSALDFRVMAESSFIRVSEIVLGMNMSWATLPRLVHLVGPGPRQGDRHLRGQGNGRGGLRVGVRPAEVGGRQRPVGCAKDRRARGRTAAGPGRHDQTDDQCPDDGDGPPGLPHGYGPVHPLDHVGGFQRGSRRVPGQAETQLHRTLTGPDSAALPS